MDRCIPSYSGVFADDIQGMFKMRVNRGYKVKTYFDQAKVFDEFCVETNLKTNTLTKQVYFDWLDFEVKKRRLVTRKKTGFFRNLAKYILYTGRDAYIPELSLCPSDRYKEPRLLTRSQLVSLFEEIDHYETKYKEKIFEAKVVLPTMCRLCLSSGLRPREVYDLRRKDVSLLTGEMFVRESKDHRDRNIVVSTEMLRLLNEYDKKLSEAFPLAEYFFVDQNGNRTNPGTIHRMINRCWKIINPGVPKEDLGYISLYLFRHEFATLRLYEWAQRGNNFVYRMIPYLRIYLGHVSIASTLYYVHLMPEMVSQIPDWNANLKKLEIGERYD